MEIPETAHELALVHHLSAVEQATLLRRGDLSPADLATAYLARIARLDAPADGAPGLGAFAEVTAEAAMGRAARLSTTAREGRLWGLPSAEKDLVARAGVPTRYGSRAFADNVPDASDPLASALDAAGAVSLGKTTTPEFGLMGFTEPAVGPSARDPWDPRNGAGGSSGGAAVAVAAGLLPVAVGSDGGGSIRIPAATVGIVGLKPSRGRLPLGSGMDATAGLSVYGPLGRTVQDTAFLYDALLTMRSYRFATSAPEVRSGGTRRIAVTLDSPWDDAEDIRLEAVVRDAVAVAAAALSDRGSRVEDFTWRPVGYAAMFAELWRMSAARLPVTDDDLHLLEPLSAWLVAEGRSLTADRVLSALAAATAFEQRTISEFSPYDAVLTPALAMGPQPLGWFSTGDPATTFSRQVEYAPFSSFVNVAGLPAIVVPMTTDPTGHPVSVQLIGRPGGEQELFALGAQLEAARGPLPQPPVWTV